MRKRDFGGFMLCFLMNLVFNLGWSVPAWILLAAHFILKISIWWFASLLIIWFFIILLRTLLISWAGDCASVRDEPKKKSESLFRLVVELRQGGQKRRNP